MLKLAQLSIFSRLREVEPLGVQTTKPSDSLAWEESVSATSFPNSHLPSRLGSKIPPETDLLHVWGNKKLFWRDFYLQENTIKNISKM